MLLVISVQGRSKLRPDHEDRIMLPDKAAWKRSGMELTLPGPYKVCPVLLELGLMLFSSWYSNCCISGFQAAFSHVNGVQTALKGAVEGPQSDFSHLGMPTAGMAPSLVHHEGGSQHSLGSFLGPAHSSCSHLNCTQDGVHKYVGLGSMGSGPCDSPWAGIEPEGAVDMCPPLGLGPPSAASSQAFLQLTAQLLACGHSLGPGPPAASAAQGMAQGGESADWTVGDMPHHGGPWVATLLGSARMASPFVSWAHHNYSITLRIIALILHLGLLLCARPWYRTSRLRVALLATDRVVVYTANIPTLLVTGRPEVHLWTVPFFYTLPKRRTAVLFVAFRALSTGRVGLRTQLWLGCVEWVTVNIVCCMVDHAMYGASYVGPAQLLLSLLAVAVIPALIIHLWEQQHRAQHAQHAQRAQRAAPPSTISRHMHNASPHALALPWGNFSGNSGSSQTKVWHPDSSKKEAPLCEGSTSKGSQAGDSCTASTSAAVSTLPGQSSDSGGTILEVRSDPLQLVPMPLSPAATVAAAPAAAAAAIAADAPQITAPIRGDGCDAADTITADITARAAYLLHAQGLAATAAPITLASAAPEPTAKPAGAARTADVQQQHPMIATTGVVLRPSASTDQGSATSMRKQSKSHRTRQTSLPPMHPCLADSTSLYQLDAVAAAVLGLSTDGCCCEPSNLGAFETSVPRSARSVGTQPHQHQAPVVPGGSALQHLPLAAASTAPSWPESATGLVCTLDVSTVPPPATASSSTLSTRSQLCQQQPTFESATLVTVRNGKDQSTLVDHSRSASSRTYMRSPTAPAAHGLSIARSSSTAAPAGEDQDAHGADVMPLRIVPVNAAGSLLGDSYAHAGASAPRHAISNISDAASSGPESMGALGPAVSTQLARMAARRASGLTVATIKTAADSAASMEQVPIFTTPPSLSYKAKTRVAVLSVKVNSHPGSFDQYAPQLLRASLKGPLAGHIHAAMPDGRCLLRSTACVPGCVQLFVLAHGLVLDGGQDEQDQCVEMGGGSPHEPFGPQLLSTFELQEQELIQALPKHSQLSGISTHVLTSPMGMSAARLNGREDTTVGETDAVAVAVQVLHILPPCLVSGDPASDPAASSGTQQAESQVLSLSLNVRPGAGPTVRVLLLRQSDSDVLSDSEQPVPATGGRCVVTVDVPTERLKQLDAVHVLLAVPAASHSVHVDEGAATAGSGISNSSLSASSAAAPLVFDSALLPVLPAAAAAEVSSVVQHLAAEHEMSCSIDAWDAHSTVWADIWAPLAQDISWILTQLRTGQAAVAGATGSESPTAGSSVDHIDQAVDQAVDQADQAAAVAEVLSAVYEFVRCIGLTVVADLLNDLQHLHAAQPAGCPAASAAIDFASSSPDSAAHTTPDASAEFVSVSTVITDAGAAAADASVTLHPLTPPAAPHKSFSACSDSAASLRQGDPGPSGSDRLKAYRSHDGAVPSPRSLGLNAQAGGQEDPPAAIVQAVYTHARRGSLASLTSAIVPLLPACFRFS